MLIILMVLICVIFCTRSRNSLNGQNMSYKQNFPGKDEDWNFRNLPKSNIPTDPNEYIDNQQYHQRRSSHVVSNEESSGLRSIPLPNHQKTKFNPEFQTS